MFDRETYTKSYNTNSLIRMLLNFWDFHPRKPSALKSNFHIISKNTRVISSQTKNLFIQKKTNDFLKQKIVSKTISLRRQDETEKKMNIFFTIFYHCRQTLNFSLRKNIFVKFTTGKKSNTIFHLRIFQKAHVHWGISSRRIGSKNVLLSGRKLFIIKKENIDIIVNIGIFLVRRFLDIDLEGLKRKKSGVELFEIFMDYHWN